MRIRFSVRQCMNSPVRPVGESLQPTETRVENTAAMPAISRTDSEVAAMNHEEIRNEMAFQATMSIAEKLFEEGAITEEEYSKFEAEMEEKYKSFFGTLLSRKHLL